MENKKIITTIFPKKLGGVYILMKNLVKYFPESEYTFLSILTNLTEDNYPEFDIDIKQNTIFNFSRYSNRYHVHKKLAQVISKNTDIIIANDWLELETIASQKLKVKTIFILHGDYNYYYELAIKYAGFIDKFVAVSNFIQTELIKRLPERKKDIVYLKNIIANPPEKKQITEKPQLNALFVGRLTEEKGFFDLELIDKHLKQNGLIINWTIIGNKLGKEDNYKWLSSENVNWLGAISNEQVLLEYKNNDLFILPTRAEGLGMVIIEAMKAGCVPIVSKLDAGIPEFVINNQTGFMVPIGDIQKYCEKIVELNNNFEQFKRLSLQAKSKAYELFNPYEDALAYYNQLEYVLNSKNRQKYFPKLNLSRLDKPHLPNLLVKTIRTLIKHPKI